MKKDSLFDQTVAKINSLGLEYEAFDMCLVPEEDRTVISGAWSLSEDIAAASVCDGIAYLCNGWRNEVTKALSEKKQISKADARRMKTTVNPSGLEDALVFCEKLVDNARDIMFMRFKNRYKI